MIKSCILFSICAVSLMSYGQSFAPEPGQVGSTAIHKDSSIIMSWANSCVVTRGPKQIDHPEYGLATHGNESDGAGAAEGNSVDVVSLGDGGIALLTFNPPIKNGFGPDFAIFENGFADHYMEFAFVEVSSNGLDYYRFPAVSETPLVPQMNNASFGNCAYIHNLAGKYRQGYGTPFDLQDLDSISSLNLNSITHIRLIDVVGNTNSAFGTSDFYGNLINDPWPTNFESSGFDLDGIGVINQGELSISEQQLTFKIHPNPFYNHLIVNAKFDFYVTILDQLGREVFNGNYIQNAELDLTTLSAGNYILKVESSHSSLVKLIVKY